MLAFLQSHALLLTVLAAGAVSIVLAPLARAKVLALRAYRARQSADEKGLDELAKRGAIDALTAIAAQLVLSVEGEVRDLKDPSKPGAWNPAVDGPRFLHRVVADLWTLGGTSLAQLRALQGLSVEELTKLLERIAEAQVQKLRAPPKPTVGATLAELAALVAEILRDPTAGLPSRPLVVTLGDEVVLPRPAAPDAITALRARTLTGREGFDAGQRQTLAPDVVAAARREGERGSVDVRALLALVVGLSVVVPLGVVVAGCPAVNRDPTIAPPPAPADAGATACHNGAPWRFTAGAWSQADRQCNRLATDASAVVCCLTPSALRPDASVHACVPMALCSPEVAR